MSRHNDQKLKEVLQEFVNQMKNKNRLHQAKIRSTWENLMGKTISTYTTSIVLRKKKLYITLSSAPLRSELTYSREKIKELLNRELGAEVLEEVIIR